MYTQETCNTAKDALYKRYKRACACTESILKISAALPILQETTLKRIDKVLKYTTNRISECNDKDVAKYQDPNSLRICINADKESMNIIRNEYSFDTVYPLLFGVETKGKAIIQKRKINDTIFNSLRECIALRMEYHKHCQVFAIDYDVYGHIIQILIHIKLLDTLVDIARRLDAFVDVYIANRDVFKTVSQKLLDIQETILWSLHNQLLPLYEDRNRIILENNVDKRALETYNKQFKDYERAHRKSKTVKTKRDLKNAQQLRELATSKFNASTKALVNVNDDIIEIEQNRTKVLEQKLQLQADSGEHDTEYTFTHVSR